MNRRLFYVGSCLAFLFLLFSCMGDKGNTVEYGVQAGVVVQNEPIVMMTQEGYGISSEKFSNLDIQNTNCYLVDYKIDLDKVRGVGPYDVEVYRYMPLEVWPIHENITDTTQALERELLLTTSMEKAICVEGHLFMYLRSKQEPAVKNRYQLSYHEGKPSEIIDSTGVRIYDLYLRAESSGAFSENASTDVVPQVFNIQSFIEKEGAAEKQLGNHSLNFRIRYASNLPHDTVPFAWRETKMLSLSLDKEGK